MKLMKLVASLLLLSCFAAAGAAGRKISDYTETLSPQDGWYFEIAVPGVTNYRVGYGTIVTGVVARVPVGGGGGSPGGNSGGIQFAQGASFAATNSFAYDRTNDWLTLLDTSGANAGRLRINAKQIIQLADSTSLEFGVAGATNLFISSAGNIGIGSATPVDRLEIRDTDKTPLTLYSDANVSIFTTDALAANKGGSISLGGTANGTEALGFAALKGAKENAADGDIAGYLALYVSQAGVGSVEGVRISSAGNVGIGTAVPSSTLDVTGQVRAASAIITNMVGTGDHVAVTAYGLLIRTNIVGGGGDVTTAQLNTSSNAIVAFETTRNAAVSNALVTFVGSHTQMVTAAIGTLTVTNALHVGTLYANILNLTNALTTNQVRLGVEDLTNSAAVAPQNGDLLSWNEGMKRWTNVVPRWSDIITNITVSTVGNVLLDFAAANVFKLVLRTNLTYTFTNTSYLTKRAKVYFLQDLIGARTLTAFSLAGGLIQTNENMQFNTNASALELMAVEKGFWVTNLITEWQRDYNPRIGPSLLAQINDDFNRPNDDPMTLNASDGVGTWTSGPGTYDDCSIDFNTLRGSTGAHNMARVLTPTFIDNQSASVVLAGIGGNLLACGPAVRIKSTTDGDCYFAAATTTTSITVSRVTDDGATITDTPVASGTFTVPTLVVGSKITLTVSGTTLEVFVNDVSQGTCTDATYSTGQPGIRMFNNTGGVDSFTATDL